MIKNHIMKMKMGMNRNHNQKNNLNIIKGLQKDFYLYKDQKSKIVTSYTENEVDFKKLYND